MLNWLRRRSRTQPSADADWKRISLRIEKDRQNRHQALIGQEQVVSQIEAILFRHDLIGINFEENTDEYRAEAETITLRRAEAHSVDDVRRIAHQEFVRWFDEKLAGPEVRFDSVAQDIWRVFEGDGTT